MYLYCPIKDNRDKVSACTYYRVHVPFNQLYDKRLVHGIFIDDGGWEQEKSLQMFFSADIVRLYAVGGQDLTTVVKESKKLTPGYAEDGKTMRYPPSIVWDIDDNIDYVHPFNSTFAQFGIRNWDGELLEPGDALYVKGSAGEDIPLWIDKKTRSADQYDQLFDIQRNREYISSIYETAKLCDGWTFSSKHLGEWFKENVGIDHYYVFPNTVIPSHYPQVDIAPHKGVRILWQGGMSHAPDWNPLIDAMGEIAKKYPDVTFVMWGNPSPSLMAKLPPKQVEKHPWMNYQAYKPWRVLMDCDINLAPLVDNMFNRCKSAIKWYEGSVLRKPEATLAANVIPYSDEMVDGETGLLYDTPEDFVEKLSILIDNAQLRQRLAQNAKKWVLENRHPDATIPGLHEYHQELRRKKMAEFEEPKVIVSGK